MCSKELYQVLAKYGVAPAFSAEVPGNSNPYVHQMGVFPHGEVGARVLGRDRL